MPNVRIRLRDIETSCHLGVPDEERARPQRILLDIEFAIPFAGTDSLEATIDYAVVADLARTAAQSRPRKLLETLALDVLRCLLDRFACPTLCVCARKSSIPGLSEASAEVRHPPTT